MELQDSLDELMPSAVPPDSSAGVQGDFRNQSDLYGGRIVEEEEEHGSLSLIVIICLLVCAAALCCICGDWIVRYSNRATSQSAELTGGSGNRDNSQVTRLTLLRLLRLLVDSTRRHTPKTTECCPPADLWLLAGPTGHAAVGPSNLISVAALTFEAPQTLDRYRNS